MRLHISFLYFFLLLAVLPSATAQQGNTSILDNTTSTPIFGVGHEYIQDLNEIVNPANGAVSVRIAAPVPRERGVNLPFYAYVYDTNGQIRIWPNFTPTNGADGLQSSVNAITASVGVGWKSSGGSPLTGAGNWTDGNSSTPVPGALGTISANSYTINSSPLHTCTFTTDYIYTENNGTKHPIPNMAYVPPAEQNAANCGSSGGFSSGSDGIITAILAGGGPYDVLIYDVHGNQLNSNVQRTNGYSNGVEDTNGNYQNGSGRPYAGTYGGDWPTSLTIPGLAKPYTFSYPTTGAQPPPSPVSLNAVLLTQNVSGIPPCPQTFEETFGGTSLPSSTGNTTINLPNGQAYTISFDPNYGLINQIQYPTGATVVYTWGNNSQSDSEAFSQTGSNGCSYRFDWPAVQTRIVSYDGVHNAQEQDFHYSTTWGTYEWTSKTTTVTTKDLLRPGTPTFNTVYTYIPMPGINPFSGGGIYTGSYIPLENTIKYYDTTGALLKTVTKSWSTGYPQPQLLGECTTLPNGQTSGTFYQYAANTQLHTDVAEYDYGKVTTPCQQPSSAPVREVVTTYQAFGSSPLIAGTPVIQDRPCSVITYGNGSKIAETDYLYDGGATVCGAAGTLPVAPISATNHDETNYGPTSTAPRGNVTSIIQVCVQGCSANSVTQYAYDETGQVVSVTDADNHPPTTYSYKDKYASGDGSPSGNTNTYLTQVTRPPTNGITHIATYTWGFDDGKMRSATDENLKTTYYCYLIGGCGGSTQDPWSRLTEADSPDGGSTIKSYDDAGPNPYTITTTKLNSSESTTNKAIFDAYGHMVQTQLTSDPYGVDYMDTQYDGLGLVWTVSNSYRSASDPTYGVTTYVYDSLGRKTLQTNADGSTQSWAYSNNLVTFKDEDGNQWQRLNDALGRLTTVFEPNGAGQSPTMETDYGYDALNNLLSVNQKGNGSTDTPRLRSFWYDSLSRLVCASNPENSSAICPTTGTGATGYSYDANGNLLQKVSPALNGATGTQTIGYCYDVLNRIVGQWSSAPPSGCNSTPTSITSSLLATYSYDTSSYSGAANVIGRLTDEKAYLGGVAVSVRDPYQYDPMGRLQAEQQTPFAPASSSYTMSHTYDLSGNTITGSNSWTGVTFTNSFDAAGRLTDVSSILAVPGFGTAPADLYNVSSYGPAGVVQATYAGVPNSTGFFNLFRYYDNRMRLVDNELYPSSDNFGTGTVAIIGGNATDSGTMKIQAGSITFVAPYTVGESALTLANAFATTINHNGGTSVIATVPTGTYSAQNSSGQTVCQNGVVPNTTTPCAVVSLKAIVVGQYGDVALSTPAGSGSSFTSTPSNTTLIGGVGSPQGGSSAYVYTLAYAKNGNITQAFDAYNGSWNYGYDTLNRLTSASLVSYEGNGISVTTGPNPGTYKNQCWSYDSFGNRLYELYSNATSPCPASSSNYSNAFQVDTNNHLTGINGNSVSRDASGNLIQDTLNNYIYDAQGRLCAVQNRISSAATQYVYDAAGNRVAKGTLSGVNWPALGNVCPAPTAANGFSLTATYLYGPGGQIDTELDQPTSNAPSGSWHQNVYGGGGLLATYTGQNGTPPVLYFTMNDWLGTKRVELDTTGRATAYWKSDPFGSYLTQVGSGTDAAENHFTGKERDTESGNDYFGARYYASSMGRWMSPDWSEGPVAVPYADFDDPQSLNLYGYLGNNPLSGVDDDGHKQECDGGSVVNGVFTIRCVVSPDIPPPPEDDHYMFQMYLKGPQAAKQFNPAASVVNWASGIEMSVIAGLMGPMFAADAAPLATGLAGIGTTGLRTFTSQEIDTVVNSAQEATGAGSTAGRDALQSHAARAGGPFEGMQKGDPAKVIRDILKNPSKTVQTTSRAGNKYVDVFSSSGQGVRINASTGKFVTFLSKAP